MAAINESYMSMYDTIDQARITEGQPQFTLLKLKENEDLIKHMEAIDVTQAKELSKLRKENKTLKDGLRSRNKRIEALVSNNVTLLKRSQTLRLKPGLLRNTLRRRSSRGMMRW